MTKLRSIIQLFVITALVATPFLVMAQTAPNVVITKEQMRALKDLEQSYKESLSTKDQALIEQSELAVLNACAQLGTQLYEMTQQAISTNVSSLGGLNCFAAAATPIFAGGMGAPAAPNDTISRKVTSRGYNVSAVPVPAMQSRLNALVVDPNSPDLTTEMYNTVIRQEIETANANEPWVFSSIVSGLINAAGMSLASALAGIAVLALSLLEWSIDITTTAKMPVIISTAWVVVRDFMNIFFIMSLILMALATILRYESYDFRNLLRRLVVMAVLVNFSLIIASTLADFSDTLINLFAPKGNLKDYATWINAGFVSGDGSLQGWLGVYSGVLGTTAEVISKVVGLVITTIAIVAVSLMMFIRVIGIWFLIMISPVAYALNVIPATQRYASAWWQQFVKYLIWGPVAMFFFAIAGALMRQNAHAVMSNEILNSLFIAAFVWAGFLVAKSAGMAGASAVVNGAQSALNKAKGYGMYMAKGSGRFAGNYLWRGTAAGHAAGAAGYVAAQFRGDKDFEKTAKNWQDKAKGAVGRTTSRIQNIPGNFEQKWIKNPQEERDKVVNTERRRTQIRRGYFNLDDEAAKKIKASDFVYAMDHGQVDEAFLKSVIANGNKETRAVIVRAIREGQLDQIKGLTEAQKQTVFNDLKEKAWKDIGGGSRRTEAYTRFMGEKYVPSDNPEAHERFKKNLGKYINVIPKDKDKYESLTKFGDQVDKSYTALIDPSRGGGREESDVDDTEDEAN